MDAMDGEVEYAADGCESDHITAIGSETSSESTSNSLTTSTTSDLSTESTTSRTSSTTDDLEVQDEKQDLYTKLNNKIGTTVGKWTIKKLLGVGTFASVYLASSTSSTHENVAIKTLWKSGLSESQIRLQKHEIHLHRLVSHLPGVITLLDTLEDSDCIYLILEYCPSDLFSLIQQRPLNTSETRKWFLDLLDTVENMHECGVFHRDLKPENVLVTEEGEVRVCDFGLSTMEEWSMDMACGTRSYLAPETLTPSLPYSPPAADIWALGTMLINMLYQSKPWSEAHPSCPYFSEFLSNQKGYFKRFFGIGEEVCRVLGKVFEVRPERRVGVKGLRGMVNKWIWDSPHAHTNNGKTSKHSNHSKCSNYSNRIHSTRLDSAMGADKEAHVTPVAPVPVVGVIKPIMVA